MSVNTTEASPRGPNHPTTAGSLNNLAFLLQAQASKAKIVGFANAGGDTINFPSDVPVIESVFGCDDDLSINGTANCPTGGGVRGGDLRLTAGWSRVRRQNGLGEPGPTAAT